MWPESIIVHEKRNSFFFCIPREQTIIVYCICSLLILDAITLYTWCMVSMALYWVSNFVYICRYHLNIRSFCNPLLSYNLSLALSISLSILLHYSGFFFLLPSTEEHLQLVWVKILSFGGNYRSETLFQSHVFPLYMQNKYKICKVNGVGLLDHIKTKQLASFLFTFFEFAHIYMVFSALLPHFIDASYKICINIDGLRTVNQNSFHVVFHAYIAQNLNNCGTSKHLIQMLSMILNFQQQEMQRQ